MKHSEATKQKMSVSSILAWTKSRKRTHALRMKRQWSSRRFKTTTSKKISATRQRLGLSYAPSVGATKLKKWLGRGWVQEFMVVFKRDVTGHILLSHKIDIAYPAMKFAIEVDGRTHEYPSQKIRDRMIDRNLKKLGWSIFRVSEKGCRLL